MADMQRETTRQALGAGADDPVGPPRIAEDDLLDYLIDHARQLASLALSAGRPQASALISLAVTQLTQPE